MTDNHNYKTPSKGESDWHIPLNDNFSQIDTDIEIRDTEQNRVNYTPKEGSKFLSVDTEHVFIGDGQEWRQLATRGNEEQSGALLVDQNGSYKGISFETNKTWSHSSDAGVVLQSLFNDLKSNKGSSGQCGYIVVGAGGYSMESPVLIDDVGFGMIGQGGHQTQDQTPVRFTATGDSWEVGDDMFFVDDDGAANALGFYMANIRLDGGNKGVHNLHIREADRFELQFISSEGTANGGEGLRVSGSYNSSIDHCFIANMHLRNNPTTGKNINQFRLYDCYFNTEQADVPAIRLAAGGNRMFGCVVRTAGTASLNSGVAAVAGADNNTCQRWRFDGCEFYGDGDPYFDIADKNTWNHCLMFAGGRGPQFKSLNACRITNSKIGAANGMLDATDNNTLDRTIIANNYIRDCNKASGDAVIDISPSLNNSENIIMGNLFRDNAVNAEIRIGHNGLSDTLISNNYVEKGIEASFGGATRSTMPTTIVGNLGHNPIGYARATPALPTGLGSGNVVNNYYPQKATVALSGEQAPYDPLILDSDGSSGYKLNGSPPVIEVPAFGGVYFRSSVPDSWIWSWE